MRGGVAICIKYRLRIGLALIKLPHSSRFPSIQIMSRQLYNYGMVTLVRLLHGALASFYMYCLGYIYYSGITDRFTGWTLVSSGVILFEGLVVLIINGKCPLGYLHRKFGDNKTLLNYLLLAPG